jgi:hypothetical protein
VQLDAVLHYQALVELFFAGQFFFTRFSGLGEEVAGQKNSVQPGFLVPIV